jgi:lipopolysaccharide transport system permease protein
MTNSPDTLASATSDAPHPSRPMHGLLSRLRTFKFFVRQDLFQRYQSDVLGMAWLILQPLITIALFAVVFSTLMRARLPGLDPTFGYTVYLIAGILAWNAFAQSITRLSGWYRDHAALYQKLALGLYLPPLSVIASEAVLYGLGMAIFALGLLFLGHGVNAHWLMLPPILGLLAVITFCFGLILGLLEVFLPDIRRAVPIVLQLGFWLTPIVYTPDILPSWVQPAIALNPIAHGLGAIQAIVVFDRLPNLSSLLVLCLLAMQSVLGLYWLGQRLRKPLRDAL